MRGWAWGPAADAAVLASRATIVAPEPWRVVRRTGPGPLPIASGGRGLDPSVPTVVVVHALTGDARASDWWSALVGVGAPIDPARVRVLAFNLLGSCYGTTGPADADFPRASDDDRDDDDATVAANDGPATITTWDQARSILLALDALGVRRVHLVAGGSLGGMVALALAALDPPRFERLAAIAAAAVASPWILAWNHVARQAIVADPGFPDDVTRGLHLARQIAMITYRAEAGFELTQGRAQVSRPWSPRAPYRIQTYLAHQGDKLVARFDGRAYLALTGAMDHHDLGRAPPAPEPLERWRHGFVAARDAAGWGVARITASTLAIGVDTDRLYAPAHGVALVEALVARGRVARYREITSPHGHDAFLIEGAQLRPLIAEAMALPAGGAAHASDIDDDAALAASG